MKPDEVECCYRAALNLLNQIIIEGHVSKIVLMCALDADIAPPAWMEPIPLLSPDTPTTAPPDPLNDIRTFIRRRSAQRLPRKEISGGLLPPAPPSPPEKTEQHIGPGNR
jgi:hypothetical protein